MKCAAYLVEREKANDAIKTLLAENMIRRDLKIRDMGNVIAIPVNEKFSQKNLQTTMMEFDTREDAGIKERIKELVYRKYGIMEKIPDHWVRYGNSLFVKEPVSREVFQAMSEMLGIDSLYLYEGIESEQRTPVVRLLFGTGGEIHHRENGITYIFDPAKVMFSPGNTSERTGMRALSFSGEHVLDMFAGIGYFTLPIAKYGKPAKVIACDINPEALNYLEKNIHANHLDGKIIIVKGDSRVACPPGPYDSIIMGNFKSIMFLHSALIRSKKGTRIIMHHLVSQENLTSYRYSIMGYVNSLGFLASVEESHIVKSYSPKMFHVSTTLRILDKKIKI